jgi:hypothetical protein
MRSNLLNITLLGFAAVAQAAAATVFTASGQAGDITASLDAFRLSLGGGLNPNQPVNFADGRREVNWDGVPAAASTPNPFPGNFFNGSTPGRARGIVFSTPGTGLLVGDGGGPFPAFSPNKIFGTQDSFVTDVEFFSPANQTTRATTNGFGVIFLDVDEENSSSIEFFSLGGQSLGKYFAPAAGDNPFSFLGVTFGSSKVGFVKITSGSTTDAALMDDFIYGEPQAVPEPSSALLLAAGVAGFAIYRRRR